MTLTTNHRLHHHHHHHHQIVLRSPSPPPLALTRRQPLLTGTLTPPTPSPSPPSKPSSNVGEVAGGTAAECLVVCCCCPCVLLEFLFLAVYKVPVTVFRRFWRKRRHKITALKKKRGLLHHATVNVSRSGSGLGHVVPGYYCDELSDVDLKEFEKVKVSIDGSDEAVELDKMMWDHFQNAGFGRSVSQRHS